MSTTLTNLSPQAFERLVQALSIKIFGPGIVVFGPGPDGAREAVYEGRVPFPTINDCWDGYIVLQAKFKSKIYNDQRDVSWLTQQINLEMKKFANERRNLRKPDFYFLATNVPLSSVADAGGKDKIEAIMQEHKAKLQLKGFFVFSETEILNHIETNEDVRRRFLAWLTPSDVIAELLAHISRPNLSSLLPLALSRDIKGERDAKLRDAGQDNDQSIPLDRVFIDLPLEQSKSLADVVQWADSVGSADPSSDERDEYSEEHFRFAELVAINEPKAIDFLLWHAKNCFKPIPPKNHSRSGGLEAITATPNRIVILGGPGQGKSTLGQFFAQLLRARLLKHCMPESINPDVLDIANKICSRAEAENIDVVGPIRFPLRVDLPIYADKLKEAHDRGAELHILDFLRDRLNRTLSVAISVDDIRVWIAQCPTVFILDGLDEVPPSSNRTEVLSALSALNDETALAHADCLVVVTTRPQGYNHDLDPRFWQHLELAPLPKSDASRYAKQLSEIKISDSDSRASTLGELTSALEDPATSLLMTTPLQVTIMFGIAHLKGTIPKDRWELFNKYYNLLRDREEAKPGAVGKIFRSQKRHIDALHQNAGFLLQLSSEGEGRNDAYLTRAALKDIVLQSLQRDRVVEADAERIANEITKLATDRLVLLSERVEKRIAFDVRSLQEYMAAAKLTASASRVPGALPKRLRACAASAHWRHVFRIAAARVFATADLDSYRDDIIAVCDVLDAGDLGEEGKYTRAGARLALDLLTDGVATGATGFYHSLLKRAISAIDIGPAGVRAELLQHFNETTKDIFEAALCDRLARGNTLAARGAWVALLKLADAGHRAWADDLILRHWPDAPSIIFRAIGSAKPKKLSTTVIGRLRSAQVNDMPSQAIEYMRLAGVLTSGHSEFGAPRSKNISALLSQIAILPRGYYHEVGLRSLNIVKYRSVPMLRYTDGEPRLGLQIVELDQAGPFQLPPSFVATGEQWAILRAVSAFCEAPSQETLANYIEALNLHVADSIYDRSMSWMSRLPWVLAAIVQDYKNGIRLTDLVDACRRGELGQLEDWLEAERRWISHGITLRDVEASGNGPSLSASLSLVGLPPLGRATRTASGRRKDIEPCLEILQACAKAPNLAIRARLTDLILFSIEPDDGESIDVDLRADRGAECLREIEKLARWALFSDDYNNKARAFSVLFALGSDVLKDADIIASADRIGQSQRIGARVRHLSATKLRALCRAFRVNQELRGLLPWIAAALNKDKILPALPASAFQPMKDDKPYVADAVARLRLFGQKWSKRDVSEIAAGLLAGANKDGARYVVSTIKGVAGRAGVAWPDLLMILTRRLIESNADGVEDLVDYISRDFDSRMSDLQDELVRERLDLQISVGRHATVAEPGPERLPD